MVYEVIRGRFEEEIFPLGAISSEEAMKEMCEIRGDYLRWYRTTDGQTGYLNQDGNNMITGKKWVWEVAE